MAKIKGWKRIYGKINDVNGITYRSKKGTLLTIQRKNYYSNKDTFVLVGNGDLKWFDTDRKAILWANNYMRENPNG